MSKKIKRWAVADCETDPFKYNVTIEPFLWGIKYDDGGISYFTETAAFLDEIRDFDGVIYAHNGGKFDWLFREIIAEFNLGEPIMLINGRVAKAKIGKCELRDSYLCVPVPLAATGQKLDFDYSKMHRDVRAKFMPEIMRYFVGDLNALHALMTRFIDRFGMALTQAGASMKTWEKMGGAKRRYGQKHDARFRPFYFGGRVQVFEYGAPVDSSGLQLFDVTSAYPFALIHDMPKGVEYSRSLDISDLTPQGFGIVRAISKGAFPYRDEKGRVFFPDDDEIREYHATGWEIFAALETGTAEIIEGEYLIPPFTENFSSYIEKFSAEKEAADASGDEIGRALAKVFQNSLYGKYGSNPESYEEFMVWSDDFVRPDGWLLAHQLPGASIIARPASNPQYFDVALAASVTGHARANLWRHICASSRVIYCDTDSILCETFAPEAKIGKRLGEWNHELNIEAAYIAGRKLYALKIEKEFLASNPKLTKKFPDGYKTASKGVRATYKDIIRAASGETVEIERDAPTMGLDGVQRFILRKIKKT